MSRRESLDRGDAGNDVVADVDARGDGVTWLGEVGDDELAQFYRGALCVAYPSLYEGFGIPIAEAMACGAPVVTSAGGATEEVAGGAAVLVDPLDPAAIAAGIEDAIACRDELRTRGIERARAFSWDDAARDTLEVYREAARHFDHQDYVELAVTAGFYAMVARVLDAMAVELEPDFRDYKPKLP